MTDKDAFRISLLGVILLAFIGGAIVSEFRIFPYKVLNSYFVNMHTAINDYVYFHAPHPKEIWAETAFPSEVSGVTLDKKEKSWDGLTLYTSGEQPVIHLIDMDGEPVHEWRITNTDERATGYFYGEPHLFSNGDILTLHAISRKNIAGKTDFIGGLAKLDKESNLLWHYPGPAHHDVEVAPDGRIYTLTHDLREDPVPGANHLPSPFLEDKLTILEPDGTEIKSISLVKAFLNAPDFVEILEYLPQTRRTDVDYHMWFKNEITHANAVRYIDREWAQNYPFFKEGYILISIRDFDALIVMDPEQERIVWAMRGYWRVQHDPELLPNGNILLFDNEGYKGGKYSRIVEYNPRTTAFEWSWRGSFGNPFYSHIQGTQSVLPNGNILVTETMKGRAFEITREGETVWEYINPVRDGKYIALLHGAQRFRRETLDFLNPER